MAKSDELLACNYCRQPIYHISSTRAVRGICQKCGRRLISWRNDLYWQLESPGEISFEDINKFWGKDYQKGVKHEGKD